MGEIDPVLKRPFYDGASIAECIDDANDAIMQDVLNPLTATAPYAPADRATLAYGLRSLLMRVLDAATAGADASALAAILATAADAAAALTPVPVPDDEASPVAIMRLSDA